MRDSLELVHTMWDCWANLESEYTNQDLENFIWPLVDRETSNCNDATYIYALTAAIYYTETIKELTPAHLITPSLYNEWVAALRSERFPHLSKWLALHQNCLQQAKNSPLADSLDLFWLIFPNNLNCSTLCEEDCALLMALSRESNVVQRYHPLGQYLFIHADPVSWTTLEGDPIGQAEYGLDVLSLDLLKTAKECYQVGTFR